YRSDSWILNLNVSAGDRGKFGLHAVELATALDSQPLRPSRGGWILVRLVGDYEDAADVFGGNLTRDHVHCEATFKALAAGHRHRVVEKNLESDVDAGGDGEADREDAGMIVGAVAEVLKHVRPLRERCLADPVRPFATHLGKALGGTVH